MPRYTFRENDPNEGILKVIKDGELLQPHEPLPMKELVIYCEKHNSVIYDRDGAMVYLCSVAESAESQITTFNESLPEPA